MADAFPRTTPSQRPTMLWHASAEEEKIYLDILTKALLFARHAGPISDDLHPRII
jgi:hypothetical protein